MGKILTIYDTTKIEEKRSPVTITPNGDFIDDFFEAIKISPTRTYKTEEIQSFKQWLFIIKYPDNKEEEIVYSTTNGRLDLNPIMIKVKMEHSDVILNLKPNIFSSGYSSWGFFEWEKNKIYKKYSTWPKLFLDLNWIYDYPEEIQREKTLQEIINRLNIEGYSAPINQIALFMSKKNKNLIMSKR